MILSICLIIFNYPDQKKDVSFPNWALKFWSTNYDWVALLIFSKIKYIDVMCCTENIDMVMVLVNIVLYCRNRNLF